MRERGSEDDVHAVPPARRRRRFALAGALAVVVVAAVVLAAMGFSRSAGPSVAASTSSAPSSSSVTTSAPARSLFAQPPVVPGKEKYVPPAMTDPQTAATRAELAALAPRLPHLALTAPAGWAQYAQQTPDYAEDIVSCPHIADRLAADLGKRWTYSAGKLPTGPVGCSWTPVPWVPDVSRFFVSIGYETGTVAGLMKGMDFCSGGIEAPRLDVPAVAPGAVLYGCDDASGPGYNLAVPDTGGTGVFFLDSTGGPKTPEPQAADALLAVIHGAVQNYG